MVSSICVDFYLCVSSSLLLMTSHILAFNLDKENAYIIEWERNAGFGHSATLWQDTNGRKWVVVGAPKLQRDLNEAIPYSGVIGGIVVCEDKRNCQIIQSLPQLESEEDVTALKYAMNESLPSIGLGETLLARRTPNPLLVCSPRNINNQQEKDNVLRGIVFRGICYVLDTIDSTPKILNPFPEREVKLGRRYYNTPSDNGGMGAFISKENQVVMGLPSMYYMTGGICSYDLKEDSKFKFSRDFRKLVYKDNYEGWAIAGGRFDGVHEYLAVSVPGEPLLVGKIIFYSTNLKRVERLRILGEEEGAQFGKSLAAGDFNGDNITDLAASAHLSTVVFDSEYIKGDSGKVYVYYSPILNKGELALTLNGMAPKAYFGFSLLSPGDLNGDGYDDLVVGAPYEGNGKVYIFNGSPQGIIVQHTQVISHQDLIQSNFRLQRGIGFSLGGGIDLDSNGYPDIMIGALYSDSAILVRSAPVLTLVMNASFSELGIINLEAKKCWHEKIRANLTCFNMTIEVYYSSQEFKDSLEVYLDVSLDTKRSSSRIVFSNSESVLGHRRTIRNKPEPFNLLVYVKPFKHLPTDQPIYAKVRASLPRKVESHTNQGDSFSSPQIRPRLDPFTDHTIETAVRFICDDPETCLAKPDLFLEIIGNDNFTVGLQETLHLNISLATKGDHAFQVRLRGAIPPEFVLTRVVRDYGSESGEISCQMHRSKNASNDATAENEILCYIADYLPVDKEVQFGLLISHSPRNIASEMLKITNFGIGSFDFSFYTYSDTKDKNEEDNGATWKLKPLVRTNVLLLSTATPDSSSIWTNDTTAMRKAKKVLGQSFNSTSAEDTGMKFSASDYVGANITHTYSIINAGPSPIVEANVVLSWPTHYRGFPLTLFRDEISSYGPASCQPLEDTLTLQYYLEQPSFIEAYPENSEKLVKRTKRNAEDEKIYSSVKDAEKLDDSKQNATVDTIRIFDCSTADCVHIKCSIGPLLMKEEVTIEINAVAIATLFDMLDRRNFLLTSKVDFEYPLLGIENTTKTETFLLVKSLRKNAFQLILQQWWSLLLSIIGGSLILILIIGICYKVGFFKRKRAPKGGTRGSSTLRRASRPEESVFVKENTIPQMMNTSKRRYSENSESEY